MTGRLVPPWRFVELMNVFLVDARVRLAGCYLHFVEFGWSGFERRSGGEELMSVKPELAFDVCWEVYSGAREVLESKRGISALNWKDTGKFLWRPRIIGRG